MHVLARVQKVVASIVFMVVWVVSFVYCDISIFNSYELAGEVVECRWYVYMNAVLQIRTSHQSITANRQSLTSNIYHVMIIATSSLSQKSFINFYKSFINLLEIIFIS